MRLTLTNDEAYELVIHVATGRLDDVAQIADVLREHTQATLSDRRGGEREGEKTGSERWLGGRATLQLVPPHGSITC